MVYLEENCSLLSVFRVFFLAGWSVVVSLGNPVQKDCLVRFQFWGFMLLEGLQHVFPFLSCTFLLRKKKTEVNLCSNRWETKQD